MRSLMLCLVLMLVGACASTMDSMAVQVRFFAEDGTDSVEARSVPLEGIDCETVYLDRSTGRFGIIDRAGCVVFRQYATCLLQEASGVGRKEGCGQGLIVENDVVMETLPRCSAVVAELISPSTAAWEKEKYFVVSRPSDGVYAYAAIETQAVASAGLVDKPHLCWFHVDASVQ